MERQELFYKTIDILVKAFFAGTLNALDCRACAVGNILGHGCWSGSKYNTETNTWTKKPIYFYIPAKNNSGYSNKELAEIEYSFITGCSYESVMDMTDEANFNGLMSVVDTLIDIHKGTEKQKQEAKLMFVK